MAGTGTPMNGWHYLELSGRALIGMCGEREREMGEEFIEGLAKDMEGGKEKEEEGEERR